ncbi:MAG: DUF6291 domain-containing protein [Bacteroidia bacterium]
MADNKKSFIAYSDWYGMFNALPNEVAGELIKHIFAYVNDENPTSDNFIINALFEQVKATLKRDLVKWEEQREQRSIAGKNSAKSRLTKFNERSNPLNETERKSTVSVSVNVNDNVSDKVKVIKTNLDLAFDAFLEMRIKIKKPATKLALQMVKKKVMELANNNEDLAIKIINQSTLNCWSDIYPLKENKLQAKQIQEYTIKYPKF